MDWTDPPGAVQYVDTKTHSFNKPGIFNVTIIVQNNFNYSEFVFMVKVYNRVENLTLNSDSPKPYFTFTEKADSLFWYTSPTDPPTEGFIHWIFDDGTSLDKVIFQV